MLSKEMLINRRGFSTALALSAAPSNSWTSEWDRAALTAALSAADASFDPAERMLVSNLTGDYRYHTALRSRRVHPTREALEYALLLLEARRDERAFAVIDRVIAEQDTDPASKWYGIWGWYLEEPPNKMQPADWNWADFNGATLATILHRHNDRLPAALRARIRASLGHAAASIRRRNVSMGYTNIAVQGTYVTLKAAELLDDRDLLTYARDRLLRFTRKVDETGSFAEYNSPTYAQVTLSNLSRLLEQVRDEEARALAAKIHERAWFSLARHWHAPTMQLAGPHSRSYSTDIGAPVWLQKALDNRLPFATLDEIRSGRVKAGAAVATIPFRCPEKLWPLFLETGAPREVRELFTPSEQGTTWLHPSFCLGSVDRGEFWVQRRPLVAYWGGPQRPAHSAQLRVIKDDYDFSSALWYSVQREAEVLGQIVFCSPGGDRHRSLEMIQNGRFTASSLRVQLDLAGLPARAPMITANDHIALDLGGVHLFFAVSHGDWGGEHPMPLRVETTAGALSIHADWVRAASPQTIDWKQVNSAGAVIRFAMEPASRPLAEFARALRERPLRYENGTATWGALSVHATRRLIPLADHNRAASFALDGKPIPLARLAPSLLDK